MSAPGCFIKEALTRYGAFSMTLKLCDGGVKIFAWTIAILWGRYTFYESYAQDFLVLGSLHSFCWVFIAQIELYISLKAYN